MLGPSDPSRRVAAERLLPAAHAAAAGAGVTRLADVTRLDRFGLPVWQAVRPMSRAVSVHQGKGATVSQAQVGALLEAVESHAAESFDAEGPHCPFEALPAESRAARIDDYAEHRARPPAPDQTCRWTAAADLLSGRPLHLPFDLVSLDLTRAVPSPFDRSSNGVATGSSKDEAILVALHELVERDAVTEWQSGGLIACMQQVLDLDRIPFGWLALWRERIAAAGASMRFFHVPTLTGSPLFVCEINDPGKAAVAYRCGQGRGCHPDPEIALFKALAEALQARLTVIAGARDDLEPDLYESPRNGISVAFGLPLPGGMDGRAWDGIGRGPATVAALAERLACAGYDRIGIVALAETHGLTTVRAFVCGLGSMSRRRRPPEP